MKIIHQQKTGFRIGLPKDFLNSNTMFEDALMLENKRVEEEFDVSISPPYYPILFPVTCARDEALLGLEVTKFIDNDCQVCNSESKTFKV